MAKYKPRAGVGAKAKVLTKMIYPRRPVGDPKERLTVIILAEKEFMVNKKKQQCFTFKVEGDETGSIYHAIQRFVHVTEEGPKQEIFDPSLPEPPKKTGEKNKWRKSKAKKMLTEFIMDGRVHDAMPPEEIYMLDEELCRELSMFDDDKFEGRIKSLMKKLEELNNRADDDLEAFRNFKRNHKPSLFSHKGYIQWQGSTPQELLWEDLDEYLKNPNMKPKDLWLTRPEYRDEFPLDAFRDKIKQEIRTQKYIATRKARSEGHKV